ncbi:MAG: UpxY family transcription antiterminator [Bacteroidetes bacterium]|nr:UpxY family transcription antiterminator [Bacteroidota bacterium]
MAISSLPFADIKYDPEPQWYILYIRSRSEKKVMERMQKRNFIVYLPLIKTVRQWSDRKKHVLVPLFNGYLFIKVDPTQFASVRMIDGVVNFVQQEKKHAMIGEEKILSIKKFIETGLPMEASSENFAQGERVKINFGPLKDCEGELINIKNVKQFIVRLEMINQVLIVNVPAAYLEKIN